MNKVNSKVITKLKQRQRKAFEIVYNEYHKLLFFIAFKITKDEQASLDIMQDAFVNFMNKIEEYEDDGKLKQYLSSIARNLSLNYVQSKAYNNILLDDNIINQKHYEDNTKVSVLLALEKCLSPLEIDVVSLKILFDYNFREIAEDLNLSIGTIQATYYRAIELLKTIIQKEKNMNVKKQFKNHMRPILNIDDCYDRVSRRIDFNEEKENRPMKKILIPISLTAIAACAVAVITFNLLPSPAKPNAIVSVDVNPSIDLVVDKNNTVISVSGANEEGKMIIAEEDIVGKDVEQAVEIIINTESETGYLIKGNVQTDENTVTITVSADTKAIKEALEETVTNTVNQVCNQLNIAASTVVNETQKYTRDALEEKALLCDPTLTEEDVEKMSYDQLLSVINLHYLETAEIYSQELENLYLEAKSSEISFAESEFVQEAIDKTNIIYQFLLEQYDNLCETLKTKSDELETLRYNTLVSEDSDYQKKLQEVNNAKADVISLRNELAASETPDKQVEILLETKEALLNLLNNALEGLGNAANASIDLLKNTVNAALEALLNLRESFPSEIKTTLQEKAKEAETFINEKKDAFFEKFEEKYKDDIARIKEDVLARKQALKDAIAQQ